MKKYKKTEIVMSKDNVVSLNLNQHDEIASSFYLLCKKKNGDKVLQQLFFVRENMLKEYDREWRDVPEVVEE